MPSQTTDPPDPIVVALDMGYGHMRPAHALAERLGTNVLEADRPPLASDSEQRQWQLIRSFYGSISRGSQIPVIGAPLRWLLTTLTQIPNPYPRRDLSSPTWTSRFLARQAKSGLGAGLIDRMRRTGEPLLSTYPVSAIAAAMAHLDRVFCVVTDSDINRAWVPPDPVREVIHYFVPSHLARRRLRSYGVPRQNIELTGFPLPHGLLGGPDLPVLKSNLLCRLMRLDPRGSFRRDTGRDLENFLGSVDSGPSEAPLVTFAVGGVGAQSNLVRRFLPSVGRFVRKGRLRLALVAGIRADVRDRLLHDLSRQGLAEGEGIELLYEATFSRYIDRFNALLARTDILWTKPSEMTFFGALGLPLVFSWPVGVQERYNRRWAIELGAGLKQHEPEFAGEWLMEWLKDGTLAAAAFAGFLRMPKHGVYRIVEAVSGPANQQPLAAIAARDDLSVA
jgi:hypothetical protein